MRIPARFLVPAVLLSGLGWLATGGSSAFLPPAQATDIARISPLTGGQMQAVRVRDESKAQSMAAAQAALPAHYSVQRGDTLSRVSLLFYGTRGDWPAVWWANRPTVHNPNVIAAGQWLTIPGDGHVTPAMRAAAVAAIPPPPRPPAPVASGPVGAVAAVPPGPFSEGAPGSYQACVVARESGGDATAVNASSGAGGLYQFLPSTWAALGYSGLPENASVAQQNQAFQRLYAQQGRAPWVSDGC